MVANTDFYAEKALLSQQDEMLSYVKHRLEEWARWYTKGNSYGLGYPPCAIEYRLMHEGIVKCQPAGLSHRLPIDEAAEEIERLVQQLSKQRPLLGEALRLYYFRSGSLRAEVKARAISLTQLYGQVEQGWHWLAGWLTAKLHKAGYVKEKKFKKNV